MRMRRTPTPVAILVMTACGVVASPAVVRAALHPLTYAMKAAQRGHSSVGRALALQARGRRFDPGWLHSHKTKPDNHLWLSGFVITGYFCIQMCQ